LAAKNSSKIKTFTVSFPGFSQHDESPHARLIADYYGTEHTELKAEPASAELLPLLARQFDEPMADSSMIPTFLVSREIKKYCSVALGGDGGDELFGGYTHYSRLLWLESKLSTSPILLRKIVSEFASKKIPLGYRGGNLRTYLMLLSADFKDDIPNSQNLFDQISIQRLLKTHGKFVKRGYLDSRFKGDIDHDQFRKLDIIQKATRVDFLNYLPEDILVKVDRASMMNSLEVRAPLLDYRIIEFAFSKIPSHLKVTKENKKILLKEMAKQILPKEFNFSRKQGFSIPLKAWLASGQFRDLFWSVLTDSSCLFDKTYILKLLNDQDKGRDNSERLFSLVLFELWRKEYKIDSILN
jgi:asparagine synthase (glutamine-hydrolysing)